MWSRWPRLLLLAYAALVLGFLVAPILAIVPLSFNGGSFLAYPLDGLSFRWYEEVMTTERWLRALRNSLIIAVPATALALVLGTLAAVGLAQARIRGKAVITGLLISPMIVPVIITAVGMYFFFAPLGLTNSFPGLILAHAPSARRSSSSPSRRRSPPSTPAWSAPRPASARRRRSCSSVSSCR